MATARRGGYAHESWADAGEAKRLVRQRLWTWLLRGAETVASRAKQEAPSSTGEGRSWINATGDEDRLETYAGIIGPSGLTRGSVPGYMGMIEKGITPHKVSLKHYGLRKWVARTFGEPEAQRSGRGFYRSILTWKSLGTFGGIQRERIGGRTAIPWLSRAVKHSLPAIRADLQAIARQS